MPTESGTDGVPLTTDEDLRRGTVGPVVYLNAPVVLTPYDPQWPVLFDREASRIRTALASLAIRVEHVGSTSVPGLAAKPIIDIVLAVPDSADEAAYVPALESAGYVLRGREPDWHEHRLLRGRTDMGGRGVVGGRSPDRDDGRGVVGVCPPDRDDGRGVVGGCPPDCEVNLHVFSAGEAEIDRMVLFRDWLRSHDDDRDAYLRVKRELARRTWRHVQHYADAKTAVVQEILARASPTS